MRSVNLVMFSALLDHAETLGIDYNDANDLLDGAGIRPEYEVKSRDYHVSNFLPPKNSNTRQNVYGFYNDARDHDDEVNRIMLSYFEEHNVEKITVIND